MGAALLRQQARLFAAWWDGAGGADPARRAGERAAPRAAGTRVGADGWAGPDPWHAWP